MMRLILLLTTIGVVARPAIAEVDYAHDVRPIFATKCVSCHGPVKQEAGLRLDAGKLVRAGSESGSVASAEAGDESLLLQRVASDAPEDRMPPASDGEPLTPAQIDILRQWIAAGLPSPADEPVIAGARDHWAYRPIVRPVLPAAPTGESAPTHPLDRLLAMHHRQRGLTPLPPADPETLLRRVTFDLTGLPPTIDEQDRFLADDSPAAWRRTVDELLSRPQFGERWGRHWMDVWRYADWDGYKDALRGSQRHIWHWRDWIVESLNAGKPYDQMIVEMLAGDEIAPGDPDTLRATGFLARNFHKSNRNIWLDATVEHTTKAFLGMTINCARCHDHKYDPIAQRDYYAFRAIFEPYHVRTERLPGEPDLKKAGLPRAYDSELDAVTYVYLRGDEKNPDKEHPVAPAVPDLLGAPFQIEEVALPPLAQFPSLAEFIEREEVAAAASRLAACQKKWDEESARHGGGRGADIAPPLHEHRPPSPSAALPLDAARESAARALSAAQLELESLQARWAADRAKYDPANASRGELASLASAAAQAERDHALAAGKRDVWSALCGLRAAYSGQAATEKKYRDALQKRRDELQKAEEALAKARENAAKTDDKYTAVGPAYPATSTGRRLALAKWIVDPRNPLTARVAVNHIWMRHFGRPLVDNVFDFGLRTPAPPLADVLDWLAAELIDSGWNLKHLHRLIVTCEAYRRASSAETSLLAHNAQVDPDNRYWWRADVRRLEAEVIRDSLLAVGSRLDATLGGPDIDHHQGESVFRRSLYFRHAYEKQMTMLTTFDAANPTDCYRRTASIVPQQALALSNSGLSVSMARAYVGKALQEHPGLSNAEFTTLTFRSLIGRRPDPRELDTCLAFLQRQQTLLEGADALHAIESPAKASSPAGSTPAQRARENLAHVLMNHNDFVTVR